MIITRYKDIEKIELEIEFLTPTFLGGADQNAELRSAPFKSLLRQWWRIANGNLSVDELRKKEGEIFGTAHENQATEERSTASRVKLFIIESHVSIYDKKNIQFNTIGINHPEVNNRFLPIEVYLGMGPIFWNRERRTNEFMRSCINPGSKCKLLIEYPYRDKSFLKVLKLIQDFGAIGARCRNGWGSLYISTSSALNMYDIDDFNKIMKDNKNYPHALGKDKSGLLAWETSPASDYMSVWRTLAKAYLDVRTSQIMKDFGEVNEKNGEFLAHKSASARHLLGYPITHHKINDESWGEERKYFKNPKKIEGRLASPVRLVIKKKNKEFVGRLLHIPYAINMKFEHDQIKIWSEVHNILDNIKVLRRMEVK